MIPTTSARSRDPFGFSYVYLPGSRLVREDAKEEEEDGIPDADVAVDDEGNAAHKTLMITRLPEHATLDDLTKLLTEFGECIVHMRTCLVLGYPIVILTLWKARVATAATGDTRTSCSGD